MYAKPIPLRWTDMRRAIASNLPDELLELCAADLQQAPGREPDNVIELRVGLLFRSSGFFLPEAPIGFDAIARQFILTSAQVSEIRDRLAAFEESRAVALSPRFGGILDAAREPLIETESVDWGMGEPIRRDAVSGVVSFGDVTATRYLDQLPDSVAFHSIEWSSETTLKIEPTTLCNFSCKFCYGRHLAQLELRPEQFFSIVESIPGLKAVEITGEGEPLLHKQIYAFIQFCRDRGLATHLITNGSALTDRNARKLIDAGLDAISISFESLDAQRFARYRPGGDFATVRDGVSRLVALKRKLGRGPRISLWVTLMRDCLEEVDSFFAFRADVGFDDGPYFQALNPMRSYKRYYDEHLHENALSITEIRDRLQNPAISKNLRDALSQIAGTYSENSCRIFGSTVFVDRATRVTPCCLLKAPDFDDFGSLSNESILDIWNKQEFRRFRFCLSHGVVLSSCEGCPSMLCAN